MPHSGCPNQCSFCNQHSIIGQAYQPTKDDVVDSINIALDSLKEKRAESEIAFFGGSFTAINREYMVSLLEATVPYIDKFRGIRISTRPDCIDEDVLTLLKKYKVTSIELGAQSLNDEVLVANNRGHSAQDVYVASKLIKSFGFYLGLQMMTGLYKSSDEIDIDTARQFINIMPDTVRIYPTVILKNTLLDRYYTQGLYKPQELDDAVSLCATLLEMFSENNIKVIRIGLHHSESLDSQRVAGAYHPAFRELCESKILFNKLVNKLSCIDERDEYTVRINPSCVSKLIGNKKSNINRLNEMGYKFKIIQDNTVRQMDVVLEL